MTGARQTLAITINFRKCNKKSLELPACSYQSSRGKKKTLYISDFCLQNVYTASCAHPMSYIWGCSPGHETVGREADYSNTSTTDVSGQPIGPICTGQYLFLNMGPMDCLETSVTNYQSTLHNIPEKQ